MSGPKTTATLLYPTPGPFNVAFCFIPYDLWLLQPVPQPTRRNYCYSGNERPAVLILNDVTLQGLLHAARHCALLCGALGVVFCMGAVSVRAAQPQADAATACAERYDQHRAVPAGTPPATAQMLAAYVGQKVSSVELAGRPELDDRDLLPLLVQHAGEPFDSDKVQRTLAALKATGKFQDVQLSVIPDIEGVRVMLILQPALYFGIYEFPGSKGFAYSRLLQVANYPPDGPYNQRDVTQASDALTKFFQQNGYFLAKVTPGIETGCATWDRERTLSGRCRPQGKLRKSDDERGLRRRDGSLAGEAEEQAGTPAQLRHTRGKTVLAQNRSKRHHVHAECAGETGSPWARRCR